jgi:hypothetical protein
MPLGKWKTFGQCVGAQKRMGHSDESARKICGKIQAETEGASGSSQYAAAPSDREMSEQMQKEDGGGTVTFTAQEIQALAQAATDGDMEKVLQIISEKVNIQEEAPPVAPGA